MSNITVKEEIVTALDKATQAGQLALTEPNAFKRTFDLANAVSGLRDLLTPQVMKPITELAGTSLGFKTDKQYPVEVIKDCLIQACINGVYPVGNMFNILANNFYLTLEGLTYKLNNVEGLKYKTIADLPQIKGEPRWNPQQKKKEPVSCIQGIKISWEKDKEKHEEHLQFPVKYYGNAGEFEAIVSKARRKALNWLWNTINGSCLSDAEPTEFINQAKDVTPPTEPNKEEYYLDIALMIHDSPVSQGQIMVALMDKGAISRSTTFEDLAESVEYEGIRNTFFADKTKFIALVNHALDLADNQK